MPVEVSGFHLSITAMPFLISSKSFLFLNFEYSFSVITIGESLLPYFCRQKSLNFSKEAPTFLFSLSLLIRINKSMSLVGLSFPSGIEQKIIVFFTPATRPRNNAISFFNSFRGEDFIFIEKFCKKL